MRWPSSPTTWARRRRASRLSSSNGRTGPTQSSRQLTWRASLKRRRSPPARSRRTSAMQIARHVDGPVKVVWTREEDIKHDMYRPYWFDRLSAGLDEKGRPVAWTHRFAGSSVIARYIPAAFKNGLDPDSTEGAIDLTY